MKKICETCRFWEECHVPGDRTPEFVKAFAVAMKESFDEAVESLDQLDENIGHDGICHRYPPKVLIWPLAPEECDARMPRTQADEWCGEWLAREASQ